MPKRNNTDTKTTTSKKQKTVSWLSPLEVIEGHLADMARGIQEVRALIQEALAGDTEEDTQEESDEQ